MTAEIAKYQPGAAALEIQSQSAMQDDAVARLEQWARSAHAAHEIAEVLVRTAFVPAQFRGEAGQATAAILAGTEVGLSPLASLRSFDLINGVAAARAITLRAIVQSQGHEIVLIESTATRCKMRGRRRGDSTWQEVAWTMDRAKDLGLTGKHNWKAQPQAMLIARATSEICRLIAADAILGIGLSVEEVADGVVLDEEMAPEQAAEEPKTRRMSRRTSKKASESRSQNGNVTDSRPGYPSVGGEESSAAATETTSFPSITDAQSAKLHASFNELGYTQEDRDKRMAYTIDVIGRDIESSNDLTKDEASQVIDKLTTDLEQPFGDKDGGGEGP